MTIANLSAGRVTRLILCGVAVFLTIPIRAGFQYSDRDLLLGFQQLTGPSDLVVNLGSITNLYAIPAGNSITITNFSTNQLNAAFATLNAVRWSAIAVNRTTNELNIPINSIWVSDPRTDINTPAIPWLRRSNSNLGVAGQNIATIGINAATYALAQPDGANNTPTSVIIPGSDSFAYRASVGPLGNLSGSFQGNIEISTPDDFTGAGQPVRSDLFELRPASGATLNTPGTYLGYLEFRPDGTMIFSAASTSIPLPPRPNITGIVQSGSTFSISFLTTNGFNYSLRYTNSTGLTASLTNWPVAGSPVAGTGGAATLEDTSSDTNRFYLISVAP